MTAPHSNSHWLSKLVKLHDQPLRMSPTMLTWYACGCSVTEKEIVAAIAQQTGRELDSRLVSLPEIKTTGSFPATIKLHPDVIGKFQVVVQKEKGTA